MIVGATVAVYVLSELAGAMWQRRSKPDSTLRLLVVWCRCESKSGFTTEIPDPRSRGSINQLRSGYAGNSANLGFPEPHFVSPLRRNIARERPIDNIRW
jgi:hypothetical protein